MADNDVTLPYPNLPPKKTTLPYPSITTRNLPMLPISQEADQYTRIPITSKSRHDIRDTQSEINTIYALRNNTGIRPVIDVKIMEEISTLYAIQEQQYLFYGRHFSNQRS